MRTIFAEYNPQRNSIDVYTSAGYMLRIDCWEAEKNLTTNLCVHNYLWFHIFQSSFLIVEYHNTLTAVCQQGI